MEVFKKLSFLIILIVSLLLFSFALFLSVSLGFVSPDINGDPLAMGIGFSCIFGGIGLSLLTVLVFVSKRKSILFLCLGLVILIAAVFSLKGALLISAGYLKEQVFDFTNALTFIGLVYVLVGYLNKPKNQENSHGSHR